MVYFKDITENRKTYMVTLDNERELLKSGTHLRTYPSILSSGEWPKFVNPVHTNGWCRSFELPKAVTTWTLQSTHHHSIGDSTPLPTLGRRIIDEKLSWGDDIEFVGEAHYIKGYWEWTEDILSRCGEALRTIGIYDAVYASLFTYDRNMEVIKAFCESWCPTTNTLLTAHGELSISLWDLHVLSGLPMDGMLYDEVVPSARELLSTDRRNYSRANVTCKHLLHAFHILRGKESALHSTISAEGWIKFWSRGPITYKKPPPRKEYKKRSKQTYNPTGKINDHTLWNNALRIPFTEVGVHQQFWNETYLAAYLACWLSTFVLPEGDANSIRPSTFKMASLMASQKSVALLVPVLASIYNGLNKISKARDLTQVNAAFPIHFVYGWLALYFKTHFPIDQTKFVPRMVQYSGEGRARSYDFSEARRRIYKWEYIAWTCTTISKDKDVYYTDGENVNETERLFFMAIRSNYLAWRFDDEFVIEPYSPHRFSRQFGYLQVPPGVLEKNTRRANLDDGLQYWRACLLHKSFSKAIFPSLIQVGANKFSSTLYKNWWTKVYGAFLEDNFATLAQLDEFDLIDDAMEGKQAGAHDHQMKASLTPLENKKRKAPLKGKEVILTPIKDKKRHEASLDVEILDKPSNGVGENKTLKVSAKGKDKIDEPSNGKQISSPDSLESSMSINMDRHWNKRRRSNATEPIKDFVEADANHALFASAEGDKALGIDNLEDSQSCGSSQSIGSHRNEDQVVSKKPKPTLGAKSEFNSVALFYDCHKQCLQTFWEKLCAKIARTSADDLSSLKDEIDLGMSHVDEFSGAFDISHLKESLDALFAQADGYDQLRSASHDLEGSAAQRLKEAEAKYLDTVTVSKKEVDQIDAIQKEIASLSTSLQKLEAEHRATESKIRVLKADYVKLKSTPSPDDISRRLKDAKDALEVAQQSLEDQDPFAYPN